MLPTELWTRIFRHMRPLERVDIMWSLSTRFPAFAYIFSRDPHLWMVWHLNLGGVRTQTRQVRFSIGIWMEQYRVGRYLPIAVRADATIFNIWDVVGQLPPPARQFISSLHLRVSRQSYFNYNFVNLLSITPRLSHLTLAVCRHSVMESAIAPPLIFLCDQLTVPHEISLTSLTLHNMVVRPSSLSVERWINITRLRIVYYRNHPVQHPPLYEVLFAATNLLELFVEVSSTLPDISRALFLVTNEVRRSSWDPRITVLEVRGDRLHVPAFISSLLSWPRITLQTIRIVYNCGTDLDDRLFYEIPEFLDAMLEEWDAVVVDVDGVSIELVSERYVGGVRRWCIGWKLYDWWRPNWVSPIQSRSF